MYLASIIVSYATCIAVGGHFTGLSRAIDMRIILNLIILGLQGIITFIALIVIYMIFVLLDYQGGIDSFIGTTLFQPIIGGLISIVTIGVCLLIGLPIRIHKRINIWWTKRIWLSIFGVVLGLSLLVLSALPSMTKTITTAIENEVIHRRIPNIALATTGWFLIGFSLLHLFPPYNLRVWTEQMIAKYMGGEAKTPANTIYNHRRFILL